MSTQAALDSTFARQILEQVPAIIYVYDVREQTSVFQNRSFAEMLGYPASADATSGSEWRRYIHPQDAATFPEHRGRLKTIRPGEALSWHFRMRDAHGEWRHFATHDVLLHAEEVGSPRLIVGTAFDVTVQKRAEERKNILLAETRHRTRNFASVIEAIGRQSHAKDDAVSRAFLQRLMGRLRALLDAGDLVLASESRSGDLRAIVERTLAPFLDLTSPLISLVGPSIDLPEALAGSLALALHELATNAAKYGSLSEANGSLNVTWRIEHRADDQRTLHFEWKEQCARCISPPTHEGFGSRLIRYAAPRSSDGKVDLQFEADGLRCRMELLLPAK